MQKTRQKFFLGLGALILVSLSFSLANSKTNLLIGNLFFSKRHQLYNIHLAQFFFTQASYPLIGHEVEFAHYQLGRTYFIQGKNKTALNEIEKELEVFPENKRSYYMLGLIYGYLNREEKAIEAFEKFINWKPDTWAGRNDKAWLEFRVGKIDEALDTIEPVTDLIDNPWVQNTYGVLLMNKKRYTEARQALLYAQKAANRLTPREWGATYPGNDPRIYATGLEAMRTTIEKNIDTVNSNLHE